MSKTRSYQVARSSASWLAGGTFAGMGLVFVLAGYLEDWGWVGTTVVSSPFFLLGLFFASVRARFRVDPEAEVMVRTVHVFGSPWSRRIPWEGMKGVQCERRVLPQPSLGGLRHIDHYAVTLVRDGSPMDLFVGTDREEAEGKEQEFAELLDLPVLG